MRVRMSPGSTSTAETPCSRSSDASVRVSSSSAALVAPYGPQPGYAAVAASLVMFTIRPRRSIEQRHRQLGQHHRRSHVDREQPAEAWHVEREQRSDAAELRRVVDEHVQAAQLPRGVDQRCRAQPASVMSPATGHDRRPSRGRDELVRPPRRAPRDPARRSPGDSLACASTRAITRPSPRLAPVTIADSIRFSHQRPSVPSAVVRSFADHQHRTSSALEVKRKVGHTGAMSDALTIGEVAARSGVATSALRFYEEQGLIAAERNDSGHRRYPRAVLRRVAFIVFAQKVGLSLEEIRGELAKLPRNRAPDRADWARLSSGWTQAHRRSDRRARAHQDRPHRVHRVRLPVARPLRARESRRSRGAPRRGAALLDRAVKAGGDGLKPSAVRGSRVRGFALGHLDWPPWQFATLAITRGQEDKSKNILVVFGPPDLL